MAIAAAVELARCAEERGLDEDHLLPTMDDWEVFPREAAAVGTKAMEQGVARLSIPRDELLSNAKQIIQQAQEMTRLMMDKALIAPRPDGWS
jgi:malate dehydrogenase (oxaloacetate-decarboxylating)